MALQTPLAREFPGAIDAKHFVDRTVEMLTPHGFDADNTLGCVGLCRDELTRPLVDHVVQAWGEAFDFSSLGAFPTLGRTGFAAARSHAPTIHGRDRLLILSMPHIGIDRDGRLGWSNRPGQTEATTACGAIAAVINECATGPVNQELDVLDPEQSLLRRRLCQLLPDQDLVGLGIAELTRVIRKAGLDDLERLIADADMERYDYAVFSGVQLHTPDGELVWLADAYVVVSGSRIALQ
jgi:hypothetical protein